MQIVEDMSRQRRIEVASASVGHYVIRIDLAGRLGRFALPFALGRTCSYSLQTSKTAASALRGAVSITSERTSP